MKTTQATPTGLIIGMALSGLAVYGQQSLETGQQPAAPPAGERHPITVSAGLAHQFNTDIDDTSADFSITRFTTRADIPISLGDHFTLKGVASYEIDDYDFDDGFSPWNTIHTFAVAPILQYKIDEQWMVYGAPILRFSAEGGADLGDAVTGGAGVGATYAVNENLTVGLGFAVVSQIEDDPLAVPLITAHWKFAEEWSLQAGFFDVATRGFGAQVNWDFTENWRASLGLAIHKSRFRLDDTGGSNDGVGEESAATVFGKIGYSITPKITAEGFIGVAAGGELRIEDDDGDRVRKEDYDSAAILGVRAGFRF